MQQVLVAAVETEIQHDAGTCRLVGPATVELFGGNTTDQLAIRAHGIHVRDDGGDRHQLAGGRANGGYAAIDRLDGGNAATRPDIHALPRRQVGKSLGNGARPTHRVPDAIVGLHARDAAQDRRRAVGRRADILHEVVEHLRHALVLHLAADRAGDGGAHAQARKILQPLQGGGRLHVDRVHDAVEGLPEEHPLGNIVEGRGHLLEFAVALAIGRAGGEGLDILRHAADRLLQIETAAVVEEAAPLRVEAPEVELLRHVLPGLSVDALQHARQCQDRWPHVEAEALLLQQRRLAAHPVVGLEKDHLVPAAGQSRSRSQAAEAASDHRDR